MSTAGHKAFVSALVLAAGTSSRMGEQNKLAMSAGGSTILQQSLAAVQAANVQEVLVVLGHEAEALEPLMPIEIRRELNPDYADGIGKSLSFGISKISSDADACFIFLADMPLVAATTLDSLRKAWEQAGRPVICAPAYRGEQGHPVLFDRYFFPELRQLSGDRGAKSLFTRHPEAVVLVETDDPGVRFDVDAQEHYARLLEKNLKTM